MTDAPRFRSKIHIEDHLGKRFGTRVVLGVAPRRDHHQRWMMRCDCGAVSPVQASTLLRGRALGCSPCTKGGMKGPGSHNWKGHGAVPAGVVSRARCSAEARGLEWAITIEMVDTLFHRQGGRCALSGREMTFQRGNAHRGHRSVVASIDRIDNTKGYTPDNVQLVTVEVNFAKQTMSDAEFVALCRDIVRTAETGKLDKVAA